ncbi:MAG: deoxyribodipyrimidine photolyase [Bacteroidia bacterium]|nr:deoxyribodipyrimidine photolyase [Bacteroidia bacterium]
MIQPEFPTELRQIYRRIKEIDPIEYGKSRNYIHGGVTYLSPYISRGVISTKDVLNQVIQQGFSMYQVEAFLKELAWRDYFQRVGQEKNLQLELKSPQQNANYLQMPDAIVLGNTGITGIDTAIQTLYHTGYIHNHCRMYIASICCNIGQTYWKLPAQWMYYHLLDGDWASNVCSWQWVAGCNSSKKYYANQENISKYTGQTQFQTFLDTSYEQLPFLPVPEQLNKRSLPELTTILPPKPPLNIQANLPTLVYSYYNLDPNWHPQHQGNRIFLLEPKHFAQYPISKKCLDFALALAQNIPGLQVWVGEFSELKTMLSGADLIFKEHPFCSHWQGIQEERQWMVPEIQGYFPSFFAYWKKIESYLKKQFETHEKRQKDLFTE